MVTNSKSKKQGKSRRDKVLLFFYICLSISAIISLFCISVGSRIQWNFPEIDLGAHLPPRVNSTKSKSIHEIKNAFEKGQDISHHPIKSTSIHTDLSGNLRKSIRNIWQGSLQEPLQESSTKASTETPTEISTELSKDTQFFSSLEYYRIATAFANKGLVNTSTITRLDAGQQARGFWKDYTSFIPDAKLPLVCPPETRTSTLYSESLQHEILLFPNQKPNWETEQLSDAVVREQILCSVDLDRVLQMEEWKEFFRLLEPSPPEMENFREKQRPTAVPPTLHFIYAPTRSPPKLYENIVDIINTYEEGLNSTSFVVNFLGKDECHQAIHEAEPRLMKHYQDERYGPQHRSDICRLVELYRKGGYYLDTDTMVVKPLILPPNITFAAVVGLSKQHFAPGIIFATPRHPVVREAIEMTLQHYNYGIHARPELDYSENTGNKILYDAYQKVKTMDDPALEEKSLLMKEILIKKHYRKLEKLDIRMKERIDWCTAAYTHPRKKREVFMLARVSGTCEQSRHG